MLNTYNTLHITDIPSNLNIEKIKNGDFIFDLCSIPDYDARRKIYIAIRNKSGCETPQDIQCCIPKYVASRPSGRVVEFVHDDVFDYDYQSTVDENFNITTLEERNWKDTKVWNQYQKIYLKRTVFINEYLAVLKYKHCDVYLCPNSKDPAVRKKWSVHNEVIDPSDPHFFQKISKHYRISACCGAISHKICQDREWKQFSPTRCKACKTERLTFTRQQLINLDYGNEMEDIDCEDISLC